MIGNRTKKIGKHLYSSKELMYIVKVTVDENLKKERVKNRYFKNNPEQWIVFLKLLESVLKLTSYVKLMQHRSLLVAEYIDIQERINNNIRHVELILEQIELRYNKRLSGATSEYNRNKYREFVAGYQKGWQQKAELIRSQKKIDMLLQRKKHTDEVITGGIEKAKWLLDKNDIEFSKLIGEADEYLLSMMLNLFN